MPNWTPGPWNVTDFRGTAGIVHTGIAKTRTFREIAESAAVVFAQHSDYGEPTTRANLHLIAAAPDLYSALEAIMQLRTITNELFFQDSALWEDAKDALAKARGEK